VGERSWASRDRRRYTVAVALLAGCAYGGAAIAFLVSADAELGRSSVAALLIAVAVMVIGVGILGLVFRAPGAYGGAMITLLISAMVLGAISLGASDVIVGGVLPAGALRMAARIAAAILGTALGVVIAAAWVPDAASSPIEAD
jgi:hypothetical protein